MTTPQLNPPTDYYPYSTALEITLKCDMRCMHCGSYAQGEERQNPLTFEDWCRVTRELKQLKTKLITLSGGEPFLYPRWRDLVRYIMTNDSKIRLSIISNGGNITEDDIKFLKEHRLSHLAISLDGDELTHDFIRRKKGAFKKVVNVVNLCHQYDLPITIATSFNKYNFKIREKIKDIVLDLHLATWQVQIVNSFGRAGEKKDEMIISHQQYLHLAKDFVKWKRTYGNKLNLMTADSVGYCDNFSSYLLDGDEWMGCNAGKYSLGIEANGNVKGCLSLQDDSFIAGNIKKQSLINIWKKDDAFAYTRKYDHHLQKNNCQGCIHGKQCKSGCLGMAYSLHGSIYENSYCLKNIQETEYAR